MNERFKRGIALIDAENSKDPRREIANGREEPQELLYSKRLTEWVLRLEPNASEALQLAARSQHICRWQIPRTNYPATKAGYHQWKNDLKRFHAETTARLLESAGYGEEMIRRVMDLNLKAGFPDDSECRTLEDALCLMFLEFQFADLAAKAEPEKVVNALRKSWKKMTERAHIAALRLPFSDTEKQLLQKALEHTQALS
jgi:hypothetical protein